MEDLIKQQIKGIFSDFLKLVAKDANADERDCQAVIYSDSQGYPIYCGCNQEYWITEGDGKKYFKMSKIVGQITMNILKAARVDLNERIGLIIKRICSEKEMQFKGFNVRIICTDEFARDLEIYLFHFDEQKEKLEWEYVLRDV